MAKDWHLFTIVEQGAQSGTNAPGYSAVDPPSRDIRANPLVVLGLPVLLAAVTAVATFTSGYFLEAVRLENSKALADYNRSPTRGAAPGTTNPPLAR